jgi:tRNA(Ile2) C34 agmatinyltransferase TiaS
LGLFGGGYTYVITPQDRNTLAVINYNVKTKEGIKQCIPTDMLKNAISENRRILFSVFH